MCYVGIWHDDLSEWPRGFLTTGDVQVDSRNVFVGERLLVARCLDPQHRLFLNFTFDCGSPTIAIHLRREHKAMGGKEVCMSVHKRRYRPTCASASVRRQAELAIQLELDGVCHAVTELPGSRMKCF
ncbi:unnamed protein product [Peronospora destructor]|uniref:Uncharacterized protein n=1 Tax=Peronospora destructor TaxID=86335 RepID=A0AAV0TEU2_9STRA|nr:unnamed protein product [Peronospora destructor]